MTLYLGQPWPVLAALAIVYGILIIATIVVGLIARRRGAEATQELSARVRSWWWIVSLFTVTILIGRGMAVTFLGFISFLALKEFLSLVPTRRVDRTTLLWVYLAVPVQFYLAYINRYGLFIVFIPVWMFLFVSMTMALRGETEGFLRAVGIVSWGMMMTVFTLSHMAYLLVSGDRQNAVAGGAGLLCFLLFTTQFNDVAQFFWGKLFGRHRIVPKVSPKKTWEGFLGGLLTTTALAAITGPMLTPMSHLWSLAAGAMLATAGFVGDVTMSAVKRDLGIKDSGSMIPGHGGILDRVDSLTYAVPVFAHAYRYFFYS